MTIILFQRGATSWGFQFGRYGMGWPCFKYWVCGCRPRLTWFTDEHDTNEERFERSFTWWGVDLRVLWDKEIRNHIKNNRWKRKYRRKKKLKWP